MSAADKAAQKQKLKNANRIWNDAGFTRRPKPPASSWWTAGAAPDAREKFVEAARARDAEQAWSNISAAPSVVF